MSDFILAVMIHGVRWLVRGTYSPGCRATHGPNGWTPEEPEEVCAESATDEDGRTVEGAELDALCDDLPARLRRAAQDEWDGGYDDACDAEREDARIEGRAPRHIPRRGRP